MPNESVQSFMGLNNHHTFTEHITPSMRGEGQINTADSRGTEKHLLLCTDDMWE